MATKKGLTREGRTANPLAAQAANERAFGGSWGTHDTRPKRRRTRATDRGADIRDFL